MALAGLLFETFIPTVPPPPPPPPSQGPLVFGTFVHGKKKPPDLTDDEWMLIL